MGYGHVHDHDHDHGHPHPVPNHTRAFAVGVGLNLVYATVEAAFGFWNDSLALLADAGHNFSDVLGLILAWAAAYVSRFPPTQQRTYGWRSSTILAALGNSLLLLVALGGIVWEAIRRFRDPAPVAGTTMMAVAAVGVVINGFTALMFLRGRHEDLNIRGAFLHMAADAAVTVGVIIAGFLILKTGQTWIDPATSLAISLIIFTGTWGLFRESANLALHAVPPGIDLAEVRDCLATLPGVTGVHDLHVWAMSTTEMALTAHLVRPDPAHDEELLDTAACRLRERFHIDHSTLQLVRTEPNRPECL